MLSKKFTPLSLKNAAKCINNSLRSTYAITGVNLTRGLATNSKVDPKTYAPKPEFSSIAVREMLRKSCLHEFTDEEVATRIELAAAYRLFGLEHWNENILNHLTAKVEEPDGTASFLINPYGLRYGEITASSLIKVDEDGNIKHPGVTGDVFGINRAGYVIHSAIHRARPDVKSIMHNHYPYAAGVSCVKHGFLELAQTSHQSGPVTYHDYHGIVVDKGEQKSLAEDIANKDILILRNHGIITAAESVGAAYYLMYQFLAATEIQTHASANALGDMNNLFIPNNKFVEKTFDVTREKHFSGAKYGIKELSAYMRLLDDLDSSYRT
ncbi:hypothetical protein POMI540_4515 [Schizosaccharomyces pombe]